MFAVNLDKLFHQILKPALGCTEPVAVALASAAAYQSSEGWTPESSNALANNAAQIHSIRVVMSRSVFKNGFAIAIPNAQGHKGLHMAAALGLFCDPRKRLSLFEDVTPTHIRIAEDLVQRGQVNVEVAEGVPEVYIRVDIEGGPHRGGALIRGEHANIACLWRDADVIYGSADELPAGQNLGAISDLKELSFDQVIALVEELPPSVIDLLRATVAKNIGACEAGLERPMGVGAGYFGEAAGIVQHISSLTAAGSDARMSGHPVEIMTSAGSGNQGVTATIPVVAYARAQQIDEMRMLKAVALSHLVTMHLTCYLGYLSALCGVAIKAGTGAACGLTYLMGGGTREIESAVKIMAATLTGMICDGAKAGCALKVSSAADMALRAASLAMREAEVPRDNGIVGGTADETIRHLVELNRSMSKLDETIVQIMLDKVAAPAAPPSAS